MRWGDTVIMRRLVAFVALVGLSAGTAYAIPSKMPLAFPVHAFVTGRVALSTSALGTRPVYTGGVEQTVDGTVTLTFRGSGPAWYIPWGTSGNSFFVVSAPFTQPRTVPAPLVRMTAVYRLSATVFSNGQLQHVACNWTTPTYDAPLEIAPIPRLDPTGQPAPPSAAVSPTSIVLLHKILVYATSSAPSCAQIAAVWPQVFKVQWPPRATLDEVSTSTSQPLCTQNPVNRQLPLCYLTPGGRLEFSRSLATTDIRAGTRIVLTFVDPSGSDASGLPSQPPP